MVANDEVEHEPGEVMEHLLLTPAEVLAVRARVETSATEDRPRRPCFAPHPVEDYPTAKRPRTALEDGSGTSDHYGFCAHDSAPTKGASVDDMVTGARPRSERSWRGGITPGAGSLSLPTSHGCTCTVSTATTISVGSAGVVTRSSGCFMDTHIVFGQEHSSVGSTQPHHDRRESTELDPS